VKVPQRPTVALGMLIGGIVFGVRIHGRGGQGVVTAVELLSVAAFTSGRHAQAFPSFGSERTGAPVVAYCRIDDQPIRSREPILRPDALVVQDSTLLHAIDVFAGLAPGGRVLLNTQRQWVELGVDAVSPQQVILLPATRLALTHLGRPVPNVAMLGGFAALRPDLISLDALVAAIEDRFTGRAAEGNIAAATEAHHLVAGTLARASHA
jgi:pyruvate ferredoxin oxidoreductase gamma subunit